MINSVQKQSGLGLLTVYYKFMNCAFIIVHAGKKLIWSGLGWTAPYE